MLNKKELRKKMLLMRESLPESFVKEASQVITEKIKQWKNFQDAKKICFYASFRREVETFALIQAALDLGKTVVLPRVSDAGVLFLHNVENLKTELVCGKYGIMEPCADAATSSVESIDLFCVPGSAFDLSGNRLGYGRGYYDRMLVRKAKFATTIALAFECQILQEIPTDIYDIPLDYIVNEKQGIIKCLKA